MALTLPTQGVSREELIEQLHQLSGNDVQWREHRAFGLVYHHSDEHTHFIHTVHNLFMSTNGLNPMAFKSLQEMEHDVVRIAAGVFHGDEEVVGTMTSGGTESILLAIFTYRQYARAHRPWVRRPEIIVPESAHAAFYKAGDYFDVKIVKTSLQKDYRADVDAMARRINRNTIGLVGSAPCYPYGVLDPIEAIGALGLKQGLPVHVDACIGSFLLPFIEKIDPAEHLAPITPYDFRVPGVTSVSADLHKYGYSAKGASVILYRGMNYLRHQFSISTDWCGGIYGSPTLAGTRPGGPIAAGWASLHALGEKGLLDTARKTLDVTKRYKEGIESIPELHVLGNPVMSILAYGSRKDGFSTYAVGDFLESNKWHVDRLQRPESLHMILNASHGSVIDAYLTDLRAAVAYVNHHPSAAYEGNAPMYGLIAKAPLRRMVKQQVLHVFETMYSASGNTAPQETHENALKTGHDVKKSVSDISPWMIRFLQALNWVQRVFRRKHQPV